jgi:phenylacetate-coenzyme A ligase PaaK-like adenylate-forming protein
LLGSPREDEFHAVTTVGLTPRILRREVRAWARYPRYWIYGHASIIDWIADHIETEGLVVGRPPDAIVSTSDQLTPLAEARIARVFGCPVHSWYGSHEFNGYVAGTLPGTRRYAFNPLLVYTEVLDEEGGPVPPGHTGRLVLTDLTTTSSHSSGITRATWRWPRKRDSSAGSLWWSGSMAGRPSSWSSRVGAP